MDFAKGYRTYAIAVVGAGLGIYLGLQPYLHLPDVPNFVFVILGFLGLYTARSGITSDTQKAVTDLLQEIIVAVPPSAVAVPAQTTTVTTTTVTPADVPLAEKITTELRNQGKH